MMRIFTLLLIGMLQLLFGVTGFLLVLTGDFGPAGVVFGGAAGTCATTGLINLTRAVFND